jgi:predicted phosphate transport protein (TIGR00153 family)
MAILFKATKQLESQIDEYLDAVSQGGLIFIDAVRNYLEKKTDDFKDRLKLIIDFEHKADQLRRTIENRLYTQTLIPEHRSDVWALLEHTDDVLDTMKETIEQLDIENPQIPDELIQKFIELTGQSVQAAEELVKAARAFFKDVNAVKDHLHKVYFYEKEADRIGNNLKRQAFQMKIDLSQKFHLRYFVLSIQNVSDQAEGVADRLTIYTIKRTI